MPSPLLSVITPSYNKHEFVLECIDSVLKQTYTDFEYWLIENSTHDGTRKVVKAKANTDPRINYVEIDFTPEERRSLYIPAYICNQVYPEFTGKYIFYISDDDLAYPNCFQTTIEFMESNPETIRVSYHSQERLWLKNGCWVKDGGIQATKPLGKGTNTKNVDCVIDGGQIIHRRDCLNTIPYPYFPEENHSGSHADGLFLQQLADRYTFYPVPTLDWLTAHRNTPKSTWTKPD